VDARPLWAYANACYLPYSVRIQDGIDAIHLNKDPDVTTRKAGERTVGRKTFWSEGGTNRARSPSIPNGECEIESDVGVRCLC
jgi:hypothetical protein